MEKVPGMLAIALVLLIAIFFREDLIQKNQPDHYRYPQQEIKSSKTIYAYSKEFNPTYFPMNSDKTFILFAVSNHGFYNLQKWSRNTGTESVTVISKVNFCQAGNSAYSIFTDIGRLHVLSGNNDTLVFIKNNINWLPESAKIKGDSVVLANDTARMTVPVYAK